MPNCKPPAIDREAVEGAVRDCYSTWSAHYYNDYYQGAGAYPPVHTDIVRGLLHAAGARTVLDAGCGPASMLRDLAEPGLERWSFDLTPAEGFDAVICFGVLPHLPAWADAQVLANLRAAVRPGGISSSFNEWGG